MNLNQRGILPHHHPLKKIPLLHLREEKNILGKEIVKQVYLIEIMMNIPLELRLQVQPPKHQMVGLGLVMKEHLIIRDLILLIAMQKMELIILLHTIVNQHLEKNMKKEVKKHMFMKMREEDIHYHKLRSIYKMK